MVSQARLTAVASPICCGMKPVLYFLVVIGLLASACGGPKADAAQPAAGEAWLSTWLKGQKIGYTVSSSAPYEGGFRFKSVMSLEISMAGRTQKVRTYQVATTASDLSLTSFSFGFESQDRKMSARGVVRGTEMVVKGDDNRPRVIQLGGSVYPMAAVGRLAVERHARGESEFDLKVFDATLMAVTDVAVRVAGNEPVTVGDTEYDALKVVTKMAGFEVETWLDERGMAIVEVSPPGMRSERTTPEEAVADVRGGDVDLLRMFRVPVDTVVPDPAAVRRVKYEITGVGQDVRFDYDNQVVLSREPLLLEVTVPGPPEEPQPLPIAGQDEFLAPSLEIQCDHPDIIAKARAAVGEPGDGVETVRKLFSWVFTVLEKEPTASFPTALDVLEHLKGDCNEHAVFFAALARSLGIPTKVAVGLVYMEGAFYYHAWNEVFLGRWIPVDATFGEFPASALHLKMREGGLSEQAGILGAVGRIGIRIVEFEPQG